MFSKVVVALDGSDYAERALEAAIDIAQKYAAELHLVHVNNVQEIFIAVGGASTLIKPENYEEPGKKILEQASQKANASHCTFETHQLDGDHGRAVVDKARELAADLIVVGSKGHSDFAGIMLGSVSHKITHQASCPCLVVR